MGSRGNHRHDAARYATFVQQPHTVPLNPTRPITLLASGLSLLLLLVVLPMAHLGTRPTGLQLTLMLLPAMTLIACSFRPNITWLTHFAFPASHLPLLMSNKALTSGEVYGGVNGLLGLLAILVSAIVFFASVTPALPTRRRANGPNDHGPMRHPWILPTLAIAFTLGPALALTLPALMVPDLDPLNAALAIGLGPVLAVGAGLWFTRHTVDAATTATMRPTQTPALIEALAQAPTRHSAGLRPGDGSPSSAPSLAPSLGPALTSLIDDSRPNAIRTVWVTAAAAFFLGLLILWTYWRP